MLKLTYRQATSEDIPALFSLSKALVDTYENIGAINYDKVMTWMQNKLRENISQYTCVYHGDTKVGYFSLIKQDAEWELDDFYVLPQFRGQGMGSQILCHCLEMTDGPVFLYVFTANTGAIRLYQKFGFTEHRTVSATRKILRREG